MKGPSPALISWSKPVLHLALAAPLAWIIWQISTAYAGEPHALGFNPIETSNRHSGIWALRILLLGLAVTPLSRLLRCPQLVRYRRMIGIWAFAYVCYHLLSYAWLDNEWAWASIFEDITDRIFITLGFAAFLLLIPLAATSTKWAMKRLKRRWKRLHQAVYAVGILAALHFFFMIKGNQLEPWIYAAILAALLGFRAVGLARRLYKRQRRLTQPPAAAAGRADAPPHQT